jgi:hypothetical protein
MEFTVTYWQHRQFSATATVHEVATALAAYIGGLPDGEMAALLAARANIVLMQLSTGFTPDDTDIIALALAEHGFEANGDADPDQSDYNTDYTAALKS